MKPLLTIWVFVTLVLALVQPSASFAKQSASGKYSYAYLTSVADKPTIKLVDVTSGTVENLPIDPPEGKSLYQVLASPTGEWLALVFRLHITDNTQELLRLVNVASRETRDIPLPDGQMALDIDHAWSPDGNYLVFDVPLYAGSINVYSYSLATGKVSTLLVNPDRYHFVWSTDSSQIAIEQGHCYSPEECNTWIETFDIVTQTRKLAVDLAPLFPPYSEESICLLNWSPGMRYMAFISSCVAASETPAGGPLEEVYIWDTQTGKVSRLTSFTEAMAKDENVIMIWALYQTHWYDSHTLVIGARWANSSHPEDKTQIVVYNLANNTSNVLSSDFLYEFAINPVSKQIALKIFSPLSKKAPDVPPYDGRIVTLTNDKGVFKLNTAVDVTGCQFAWSPDGAYLFFNKYTGPDCVIRADKFAFLDKSNNEVKLTLPAAEGDSTPIGWVVTPPTSAAK
ncbi:MAG: hypothetical protein ABI947_06805 [Chloroflexota bacterium]